MYVKYLYILYALLYHTERSAFFRGDLCHFCEKMINMKVHQEKKRAKFRVSFIFLFIIASFVSCFVFYMKGDFDVKEALKNQSEGDRAVMSVINDLAKGEEEPAQPKIINPVQYSDKENASYYNDILLVGGTQLAGLVDYRIIPSENIVADDSLSLANIDSQDIIDKSEGKKGVYIMIGMNDLDAVNEENSFENMGALIDSLREKNDSIKIYLVSLMPITARTENGTITNFKVDSYNAACLAFANTKEVYYLDMNTEFVGNDGKLPESDSEGGYRLTKQAYERMGSYILTHIGE